MVENSTIFLIERAQGRRRRRAGNGGGDSGRETCEARVGESNETGSDERRGTQIGVRVREIANQRGHVLDFIGVEEAQSLVNVGRDATLLECLLEFPMARARSEEDGDVARSGGARHTRLAITDRFLADDSCDLVRHRGRTVFRVLSGGEPEGRSSSVVFRFYWKSIRFRIGEVVRADSRLRDFSEQVVHELQELWKRAEAATNRSSWASGRPETLDVPRGLLHHGDVGVAEPVNRLLSIADDENGRLGREAHPLSPGLNQERHQLPLRTAGVLEFVNEHVVVSRLQSESALRELVHLTKQVERTLQNV